MTWVCKPILLAHLLFFNLRLTFAQAWVRDADGKDLTFSRGARLITGIAPTDFNFNEEVAVQRPVDAIEVSQGS